jgi:hypothetical protein
MILILAMLMTSLCLAIQAAAGQLALRILDMPFHWARHFGAFHRLSGVLGVLFLGIFAQMAVWALVWYQLGEFATLEEALYFSGVTFTSLGYGDVLVKSSNRLLAPLEATTGLIMFAVLTAVFLQALQREVANRDRQRKPPTS